MEEVVNALTNNEVLLYVTLGMFCTWFVQVCSRRYKRTSRMEKVRNSFLCSILTAAICIPVLEYFQDLPPSTALIIGAVIGTLGIDGWERLINLCFDLLQFRFGGSYYQRPPQTYRHSIDTGMEDDDEPPMPRAKRK